MKEKDPIEVALWDGALATVKSLWGGADYGYGRSAAVYSADGSVTSLEVTTDKHNSDGTNKFYTLEFKVTESVDHGDRHWGPNGYILNQANLDPQRVVRINHQHYYIEPDTDGGFQGMGGRPFTIVFDDGREVVTRNLWSQGTIPPKWWDLHPDNAKFKTAERVATADGGYAWNSDADKKITTSADEWENLLQQSTKTPVITGEQLAESSKAEQAADFGTFSFTDVVETQCEHCADVADRIVPTQDYCTCDQLTEPEYRDTEYMFHSPYEDATPEDED